MAVKDIKTEDLFKSVYERAGGLNNIRFVAIAGTGVSYMSAKPNETKESVLKKLVSIDADGFPAIRYVSVTANVGNSAVMSGGRIRTEDELVLGSIEMSADGLPAIRIKF